MLRQKQRKWPSTNIVILCALTILALSLELHAFQNNDARATQIRTQTSPVEQLSTTELFSRLAARRIWQETQIKQLSAIRDYKVTNSKGKNLAKETVLMDYTAPHTETFTTKSKSGSRFVRTHVFRRLMDFERKRRRLSEDRSSLITAQNYDLKVLGGERIGKSECLVVRAIPRRKERDLFQGTIWIEDQHFAIVKIIGDLAKGPSFWVKHVQFVREYLPIGDFWLPSKQKAISTVRIFGKETLTIDYRDYVINGQSSGSISSDAPLTQ